jgi:hypothetical protein
MAKYQMNVEGRNYLMRFHPTHRPEKHGFYTKFFVEAATPDAAEDTVVDLLPVSVAVRAHARVCVNGREITLGEA